MDDATIIRRIRGGDGEAFATLVERYHDYVLVVAERVVGNRDDALDVGQDVLLKAYRHIGDLRRPDRLRPWLCKTARNRALEIVRRRRHEPVSLRLGEGTTICGERPPFIERAPSPADDAERNDLRAATREKLAALAVGYETIIRMHYLEGIGVGEIARRLGVAVGTAKWRLSQARRMLRKELMMSEVSDGLRNEATSNPLLSVTCVHGSAGPAKELRPWEVMKTLLSQQILFCVRKERRTAKEISAEVKADISYVNEHLARMTEAEIVEEEDGRYRAACILFDREDIERLKKELGGRGREAARVIAEHSGELDDAISRLSPASQGFDEGLLGWIVLPTMVLNFGVRRKLERSKGLKIQPPARPCGGAWFFQPRLAEDLIPVELGCNVNWTGSRGFAQYWNSDVGMTITRPSAEQAVVVFRLGDGPVRAQSFVDVFSEEALAGMIEKGLVRKDAENVVSAVPIFTPKDGDVLDPVLGSIIDDVVERVYASYPDDVYSALDSLGFSFIRRDYPCHAGGLAQLGAVRALVEEGVLPPAPSPVPPGWGFFAWSGTFAPMHMR